MEAKSRSGRAWEGAQNGPQLHLRFILTLALPLSHFLLSFDLTFFLISSPPHQAFLSLSPPFICGLTFGMNLPKIQFPSVRVKTQKENRAAIHESMSCSPPTFLALNHMIPPLSLFPFYPSLPLFNHAFLSTNPKLLFGVFCNLINDD